MLKILAISGSLRRASSNTAILRASACMAPAGVAITLYEGLGHLPHFNPDLEGSEPVSVLEFRKRLRDADGILISSPEYAHGVTGVIKNALDWVVGSGEFVHKPVALLNTSPRAKHAHAHLKETIQVMMAHVVEEASLIIPLSTNQIDEVGIMMHPEVSTALELAIQNFVKRLRCNKA